MDTPEDRVAAALAPFLKAKANATEAATAAIEAAGAMEDMRLWRTSDGLVYLEVRKAVSPELALMLKCMILADEEIRANPDDYEDDDDVEDLMERLMPAAALGDSGGTH